MHILVDRNECVHNSARFRVAVRSSRVIYLSHSRGNLAGHCAPFIPPRPAKEVTASMARKLIKRFMPDPQWIKQQRALRFLGTWIHDPHIWHLNRDSVAKATLIGLILAFIPLPIQMLLAGVFSVLLRANMAVCVVMVWLTNPLTMVPIYYAAYRVGAAVLGTPGNKFSFDPSWTWVSEELSNIWEPFLLGCLLCGLFFGLLGSALVRWLWRLHTMHRWHERSRKRQLRR